MAPQRQPVPRPIGPLPFRSPSPTRITRKNSAALVDNVTTLQSSGDEDDKIECKREAERQALFQKTSNEALEIPNGYLKVAVKIIRWDKSIDDFEGHTEEVERLQSIFTQKFGYECNVHSITNLKKPQVDLNKAILDHVHEFDDPNNLLIIYYTGHGTQIDGRGLELSANQDYLNPRGRHQATAFWDKAEDPIQNEMEGDALVILDCCMASSAALKSRNGERRTYQLLAASSANSPTSGPGQNSFTTALCDSLEELLEESTGAYFLLTQLCERINTKRRTQACIPWDRLQSFKRTVQLGRLDRTQERDAAFRDEAPERASLLLRLSLRTDDLKNNQIIKLANQLPHVCHEADIPLRRVSWAGMTTTKREAARISEADRNDIYVTDDNTVFGAPVGGFFKAVKTVNTAQKFRKAVKRKHANRLQACEVKGEAALYAVRTLVMMLIVMGGLLFFLDNRERWILLGFCTALVLTYKVQSWRGI